MNDTLVNSQFLTFSLGDEDYAVTVSRVREVLELVPITRVPRMPGFMLGVINLRGSVVPVVDLRIKLDLDTAERTQDSSIIIVEVPAGDELILLGVFVDRVHEVVDFHDGELEPTPKIGTRVKSDFISGVGKRADGFVLILDMDVVFADIEATSIPVDHPRSPAATEEV